MRPQIKTAREIAQMLSPAQQRFMLGLPKEWHLSDHRSGPVLWRMGLLREIPFRRARMLGPTLIGGAVIRELKAPAMSAGTAETRSGSGAKPRQRGPRSGGAQS